MNKLFTAMQYNDAYTENGMPTHSTSGSYVLDMFFKMGGSRGMSEHDINRMFERAMLEDKTLALKAMFYNRDVRGGQGERRSFRSMFKLLSEKAPELAERVYALVPEYGRWDDLFVALGTSIEGQVASFIFGALKGDNALAKKWMPRENKAHKDIAVKLMKLFGLTPAQYRRLVSFKNNELVENKMCADDWNEINYSQVPSIASKNYRTAFYRHDGERYKAWLDALEKGDKSVKINAGAIFPHDIVGKYLRDSYGAMVAPLDRTLEQQWKALPDFVKEGLSFLPVVDVSGSMAGQPLQVAVSLGIYLAERNKSVFKDGFVTFSERPTLQILKSDTLHGKVKQLVEAHWDMNTNLEAVFNLMLSKAVAAKLSDEDMPKYIVILSDMQFDQCVTHSSDNAIEMIRRKYANAGYTAPQVVFWNLRTSEGTPVKFDENGTCLVSGFSPSIMKNLLGGELNPMSMMLSVLNSERYAPVEKAVEG